MRCFRILLKWLRNRCLRLRGGCAVEYRKLPLSCKCGWKPKHIANVGLSSDHGLVIQWRCPRCHREVCVIKSLADCWKDCPTEAEAKLNSAVVTDTPADRKFLLRL